MEWGLTPEYINRNWTEELLALMFQARLKRFERAAPPAWVPQKKYLSNDEFFRKHDIPVSRKRRRNA